MTLMDREEIKARFEDNKAKFLVKSVAWSVAMSTLQDTMNATRALLAHTNRVHSQVIKSDPIKPSIPVSKMVQAKNLFKQHRGTRAEMVLLFMNQLNMSEAGAKTYATKVMS